MSDKSFFKSLRTGLNKHMYSEEMRHSTIGNISEWIPSDFLDFNRICSGDLNLCLPAGKTLCVAGPEHSGKTFIIMNLFKHAQAAGYHPILFETEGAWTDEFCESLDVDPDNLTYNYVVKIEDLIIGLEEIKEKLKKKMKADGHVPKIIMALDSLGNLDTYKKERDTAANKAVLDQGLQARYIKSLFKTIKELTVVNHIPFIYSNHLVGNPGEMYAVEDIVGGKAPKLQSDIIAVLRNKPLRTLDKTIYGSDVTITTRKNRFYPPHQKAKVEIDFSKGPNSYAGIVDIAIDLGMIQKFKDPKTGKEGTKYVLASDPEGPKYWAKDLFCPEVVNEEMITELNKTIRETGYSSSVPEAREEIIVEEE